MTTTTVARRPSTASRRSGYVIAAVINAVLLWLIHVSPGWDVVPFLTGDFQRVLWLIDLSLVVTLALNVLYLFRDPRRLTAAGAVLTSAIGVAAAVRMLQVFPFDFGGSGFWPVAFRIALWLGIVGGAIAVVVNLVAVTRSSES
jgi:hypothetical protein